MNPSGGCVRNSTQKTAWRQDLLIKSGGWAVMAGEGGKYILPFVLSSWELLPSLTSEARPLGFCVRTLNPDLFDKTRSINKPRSNICLYELAINRRTSFYRSLPLLGIAFSPLGSWLGGYEKGPPLPCQSLVIREWELVLLVGSSMVG